MARYISPKQWKDRALSEVKVIDYARLINFTFTEFFQHNNERDLEWCLIQQFYHDHPECFEWTEPHGEDNHISVRINSIGLKQFNLKPISKISSENLSF